MFPGSVSVLELKRSSMMQRLSGWMPTAIRGEHGPADLALSLAVRELEEDSFIFALCQDHKLRMWSFRVRHCSYVYNEHNRDNVLCILKCYLIHFISVKFGLVET